MPCARWKRSHGFKLVNKAEALGRAELVILLHRQRLPRYPDLQALRPGAMLALVTSADDDSPSARPLPWAERGGVSPCWP